MAFRVERQLVAQQFRAFTFAVAVTPLPLASNVNLNELITTFMITVPAAAANSVWLGNAGVAVNAGLELIQGTTSVFRIDQEGRQMYELQAPLINIESVMACKDVLPESLPFVVWDLSTVFLIASAGTTVSCATFKAMFI